MVSKVVQVESIPLLVTKMQVREKVVCYCMSKVVVIQSLEDQTKQRVINREAKITTLSLSPDGSKMAFSDVAGKIFILHNLADERVVV